MSEFDNEEFRKLAGEPDRNTVEMYDCGCGPTMLEAADEIDRLQGILDAVEELSTDNGFCQINHFTEQNLEYRWCIVARGCGMVCGATREEAIRKALAAKRESEKEESDG